jgi:hypothetical protein
MSKSKLSLEKFRIAELNNPKMILGGRVGNDDGTKDTIIIGGKCKQKSDVYEK